MKLRVPLALALSGLVAVAALPADAAKKHRTISGSYTVSAPPDPTMEATGQAGKHCLNVDPASAVNHPFSVPAAGVLHVVLDSQNVGGVTDWDLYILDADGSELDASHGATAHEETTDPFKNKQGVTIRTCNLLGAPSATVTWTFTYK